MSDFEQVDVPDGPPIDFSSFEIGAKETVCTQCWTVHAGECP